VARLPATASALDQPWFAGRFLTITHGQNAFLTAALLTWGLLLLRDRPILAGILLGAVSFKPQLALLLPFALVAGRHWESVVAAFLTVLGLSLVTVIFFGTDIWRDFVSSTAFAHQMLELGLVPYFKMQSVFAAMRLSGSSLSAAYAAQGAAAVLRLVWSHTYGAAPPISASSRPPCWPRPHWPRPLCSTTTC
jgi:alpha-1,2-mannosyltransferase